MCSPTAHHQASIPQLLLQCGTGNVLASEKGAFGRYSFLCSGSFACTRSEPASSIVVAVACTHARCSCQSLIFNDDLFLRSATARVTLSTSMCPAHVHYAQYGKESNPRVPEENITSYKKERRAMMLTRLDEDSNDSRGAKGDGDR